jgi:hypothetical protein
MRYRAPSRMPASIESFNKAISAFIESFNEVGLVCLRYRALYGTFRRPRAVNHPDPSLSPDSFIRAPGHVPCDSDCWNSSRCLARALTPSVCDTPRPSLKGSTRLSGHFVLNMTAAASAQNHNQPTTRHGCIHRNSCCSDSFVFFGLIPWSYLLRLLNLIEVCCAIALCHCRSCD